MKAWKIEVRTTLIVSPLVFFLAIADLLYFRVSGVSVMHHPFVALFIMIASFSLFAVALTALIQGGRVTRI